MNHFRIGGKVVCIFEGPWVCWACGISHRDTMPICGKVYTVNSIQQMHVLVLELAEFRIAGFHGEPPVFAASCFRPVIERSTDISALSALLNPANHKPLEVIPPTPGDRVRDPDRVRT